jgi:hypothetical protein
VDGQHVGLTLDVDLAFQVLVELGGHDFNSA